MTKTPFKRKNIMFPAHTKAELTSMVEAFFAKGGVIKVYPTRYASGAFRSTIVSTKKCS